MISQEIPLILCNLKFRWRVHMNPPLVPVLNQITRVHALPSHFFKISFRVILPNTPTFSVVSFLRVSPPKPYMHSSSHPYEPHAQPNSFFSILSPAQYWVRSTNHLDPLYAMMQYTIFKFYFIFVVQHYYSSRLLNIIM